MLKLDKVTRLNRAQIKMWDRYRGSKYDYEYHTILQALETESMSAYLDRIEMSQSRLHSDKVFSYVLTNSFGIVVGFTYFYVMKLKDGKYDMFIQSIAVHPKYRNRGYAKKILSEIFMNSDKYIGKELNDVGAFVFPWNGDSLKLFDHFAEFERKWYRGKFYLIIADYQSIKQNLENYNQSRDV